MTPLRVLVVDDDDLMRAGLRAVLSTDETVQVVGEAADGRAAVERTRVLRPDLVLMDVRMPELDGIAATRQIVAAMPGARVLMLTTFSDDDYVVDSLAAGASGFLLKRTRPERLLEALHVVAAGESLLSPAVTRAVVDRVAAATPADPAAGRRLRELTPRERDVLQLIARGRANAEIAADLGVEESTVKTHVKRILAKLGLRDRVHAVIFGYEAGLVRPGGAGRGNRVTASGH